jgi:hypothetical protein
MRFLILLFVGCLISIHGNTQSSNLNYSKYPYWIAMMDDSTANYFEAQKAYDSFWKGKVIPLEEEETMGMKGASEKERKEKSTWLERFFGLDKEHKYEKYRYECKRFEHWKLTVLPFVQSDGSILYPHQQLLLWKEARP